MRYVRFGFGLLIGILLVQVFAWRVWAQTPLRFATVSWTAPPMEWENGTPIPGGVLYGYEVRWRGATQWPWLAYDTMDVSPTATSAQIPMYCGAYIVDMVSVVQWNAPGAPGAMVVSNPTPQVTISTGVQCPANVFNINLTSK